MASMQNFSRRTVLKMAGGATLSLGLPLKVLGILADGTMVVQDHRVPAEKNLSDMWKRTLVDRGEKEIWTGEALESIGMPVGGIATGQLYLCGDGTLGCWELFNSHEYQNEGPYSYAKRPIPKTVKFGFTLEVAGKRYPLDKTGFHDVGFKGEFPVATVTYSDPGTPIFAEMTAYSPFIPLNAKDSGLPATIFDFTLKNMGADALQVDLIGHLENACARSAVSQPGTRLRRTHTVSQPGFCSMTHSADPATRSFEAERPHPRSTKVIADFEGDTYGDWKVEGKAFGIGPAKGTLAGQQNVTGYIGHGLVNSFIHGDTTTGKLTSPEFMIERDFITFKIGGGNQPGKECINLLVDGKAVRTATGIDDEKLLWEFWNVRDLAGKRAQIEIVDASTSGWGHINLDEIVQSDKLPSAEELKERHGLTNTDTGSLTLAVLADGSADDSSEYKFDICYVGEVQPKSIRIEPGHSQKVTFVLTWNFPNHENGRNYSNYFKDSHEVASYVAENYRRLSSDTKLWRDTFYDSTLPYWLLDRLHSTIGNLCTGTTEWWKSGRFWSWEGVVCCSGTCTHVWNYEHSMARLFPELERNIRDRQDFGAGFDEVTGLVGFRSDKEYAADGQCGTILKAYREHLTSADNKFLTQHYPRIKKALQFLIQHDGNGDGIIEDAQPNTYDIDFFGANTFVGSLYLAALRAGEEMAKEQNDTSFADQCRAIYTSGREATMKRLWNGEYFIQEVDESKYKKYQYGPGCLADQLFGQGWAHQVGLGHIYPAEKVLKGLQSVWKYNWAPDVANQNKRWPPQRPFALPGEGGLFTCTWPIGGRENEPVLYRDEVWTGIEYQVAGHMIWEGMVEEGLSICRAVHERYHPSKRNPYNEVECSDHYSRAMASWGVLTALSGFEYHGPDGRIGFAPRLTPENFRSVFTTAEGWGTYSQTKQGDKLVAKLALKHGKLRLTEVRLEGVGAVVARLHGRDLVAKRVPMDGKIMIAFEHPIELAAGHELEIHVG
jgi:uncharacterized protein (DUF608 family)